MTDDNSSFEAKDVCGDGSDVEVCAEADGTITIVVHEVGESAVAAVQLSRADADRLLAWLDDRLAC